MVGKLSVKEIRLLSKAGSNVTYAFTLKSGQEVHMKWMSALLTVELAEKYGIKWNMRTDPLPKRALPIFFDPKAKSSQLLYVPSALENYGERVEVQTARYFTQDMMKLLLEDFYWYGKIRQKICWENLGRSNFYDYQNVDENRNNKPDKNYCAHKFCRNSWLNDIGPDDYLYFFSEYLFNESTNPRVISLFAKRAGTSDIEEENEEETSKETDDDEMAEATTDSAHSSTTPKKRADHFGGVDPFDAHTATNDLSRVENVMWKGREQERPPSCTCFRSKDLKYLKVCCQAGKDRLDAEKIRVNPRSPRSSRDSSEERASPDRHAAARSQIFPDMSNIDPATTENQMWVGRESEKPDKCKCFISQDGTRMKVCCQQGLKRIGLFRSEEGQLRKLPPPPPTEPQVGSLKHKIPELQLDVTQKRSRTDIIETASILTELRNAPSLTLESIEDLSDGEISDTTTICPAAATADMLPIAASSPTHTALEGNNNNDLISCLLAVLLLLNLLFSFLNFFLFFYSCGTAIRNDNRFCHGD
jgi:hypothetical protein